MLDHLPTVHTTPKVQGRDDDWWRGAVIYQIYPRSFCDSNGDGIGDLAGITSKIDYITSLGVDAIWISPFYQSPMKDFGYDVADYCKIDPIFGDLRDFDRLQHAAHTNGLKLMIDFVPSHTSDQHAWFVESRASSDNDKSAWYVWANAREDGSPPNNWLSVFGGPAWTWEPRRRQYYLHNFLAEQPDINFHNRQVVAELIAQARFWLERGVDGFRVDAIDFGVHDLTLSDNPARRVSAKPPSTPFEMQYQRHNKARPELSDLFLKPLWHLTAQYPSRALLGEISGDHALTRAAEYAQGGGLDMTYSFDLLTAEPTPGAIRQIVERLEAEIGDGWVCWAFSNHDVPRSASQFGGADPDPRIGKLIPVLLCCLRGSVCLYQGEELGLSQAELRFDQLVDPLGIRFYPENPGRDGCRTPMPWRDKAQNAGFSEMEPWLPVVPSHRLLAVDRQDADLTSTLNLVRGFLKWRKGQPALIKGTIRFIDKEGPFLCFERSLDSQVLICAFNLSKDEHLLAIDASFRLSDCPANCAEWRDGQFLLPGWSCTILTTDREE